MVASGMTHQPFSISFVAGLRRSASLVNIDPLIRFSLDLYFGSNRRCPFPCRHLTIVRIRLFGSWGTP